MPASLSSSPLRHLFHIHRHRLPVWVSGLIAGAVSQTWFRPGRHTAAGDVLPFIRNSLSNEVFDLWNHQLTAAGGVSAEIVRIFDLAFIHLSSLLGLPAYTAQRLYFTFLAVFAAVSVARMVLAVSASLSNVEGERDLPRTLLLVGGLAGVLSVVNPYWMVLIPNPIFLAVIGLAAHTTAGIWRAAAGRRPSVVSYSLVLVALTILGTNPPLVAVWTVWTLSSVFTAWWVLRPTGWFWGWCLRAGGLVALLNAFWAVPLAITLTASSTQVTAEVSAEAWSWSHAQNSLQNVAGLNAFWGWIYGDTYLSFTSRLDEPWWALMRFALPLASLAALIYGVSQRTSQALRRLSWILIVTTSATIILGKGLHPPLGGLNRFLYDHLPGMWLLREPISKVGWVILFCYLVSIAASLAVFIRVRRERPAVSPLVTALLVASATLVAGFSVAYPHPLYTGEAVPAKRQNLPGAYVELPSALADLASAVDAASSGRVMTLPHSTFYQMGHSWGYYGVDQVYAQLLRRPVVSLSSGGYFGQDQVFISLSEAVESHLEAGNVESAVRVLARLGVDVVVVRFDYDPSVSQRGLADPHALDEALRDSGLEMFYESELAHAYKIPGPSPIQVAHPAQATVLSDGASPQEWVVAASLVDPGTALISGDVSNSPDAVFIGSEPVRLPGRLRELLLSPPPLIPLALTPAGEILPAAEVLLGDGTQIPLPALSPADTSGGTGRQGLVALRAGGVVVPAGRQDDHSDGHSDGQADGQADGLVFFLAPLGSEVEFFSEIPGSKVGVDLHACSDSPTRCLEAALHVTPASGPDHLLISITPTRELNSPVEVCVRDENRSCLAQTTLLPRPGDTSRRIAPAVLMLDVADLSDSPDVVLRSSATLSAKDLSVVLTGVLISAETRVELPDRIDLPAASAGLEARFAHPLESSASVLPADVFSDLEDCDRSDAATFEEAGLGFYGEGSRIRLSARRHSACVWANLGRPVAPALRVSFDYETVSGRPPRFCLWQTALSRCASAPSLSGPHGRYDELVDLDTGAGEVLLFIYADAPSVSVDVETEVVYGNLSARPVSGFNALAVSKRREDSARVPLTVTSSGQFPRAVTTEALPAGLLVVVSESYSRDLLLIADGDAVDAVSVKVDGWKQGWVLSEEIPAGAELSVRHRLEVVADIALWLSGLTAFASLGALAISASRRRARSRAGVDPLETSVL